MTNLAANGPKKPCGCWFNEACNSHPDIIVTIWPQGLRLSMILLRNSLFRTVERVGTSLHRRHHYHQPTSPVSGHLLFSIIHKLFRLFYLLPIYMQVNTAHRDFRKNLRFRRILARPPVLRLASLILKRC